MSSTTLELEKMRVFAYVCLITLCGLALSLPHPGIIRPPDPDEDGNVHLKIPRGGAIIQPLLPINNSIDAVEITFVIDGQACDVNDPLIFLYRTRNFGGQDIILSFTDPLFNLYGCCSAFTTVNMAAYGEWNLRAFWNGYHFTNEIIPDCCSL